MLPPGVAPSRLVRVAVLAPRQQALLLLQRSAQHAVRLQHSAAAWRPVASAKSNGLGSNAVARDPRSRHQRCVHQAGAAKPIARSIRQLLRDAPPLPYKERRIEIATCGDLYKKWRAEGRRGYQGAPDTGARVPVVYIHTGLDRIERGDRNERPLSVLLTGAPGQYQDYSYNIPFLDQNGVDVLCFNWPDFAFSLETGYWWHSCDEKTSLLVDFLKKLDIKKIDMLVSHSSGSTPAVQLVAEETEIDVKSLALLMPIATRHFRWFRHSESNRAEGWIALRICALLRHLQREPRRSPREGATALIQAALVMADERTLYRNFFPRILIDHYTLYAYKSFTWRSRLYSERNCRPRVSLIYSA
ncbi:uncharacterized protein [Dermacentor albipictus]|uniref:uncharacterized protein isoform X2 n=1 Tax=Dermacentor albipictus TaxID=60249 RepID=UPI0038FCC6EC